MGDVTTNVGIISYDNKQGGRFGINLRYPQNLSLKKQYNDLQKEIKAYGFDLELGKVQQPHFVDKNDPFVQKLVKAYRNQTGDMSEPYTIGGEHMLEILIKGVAFGAMFEDSEDLMHQKE